MSQPLQKPTLNTADPKFQARAQRMSALLNEIHAQEETIRQGGGAKAIESQRKKGRLTARERIALLQDDGSRFFELSLFAAFGMYEEWGGAPSAGVITGLARV